jgi:glycosyltransferase involved in cell wall biosynthesis
MPIISLVCATKGRTGEVEQLLDSLVAQKHASMEVIIVDQNQDDRLVPIINAVRDRLDINHLRMEPRGVSAARNAGFRAARGRIVSFPDDDCWYPSTLVRDVEAWFNDHSDYKILAVGCTDQDGVRSGNRWFQEECDLKVTNSLRTTMCPTMFFDCTPEMRKVFFDESLNYGEDTDFCLRQLKTGVKGRLDSKMNIYHPVRDMLSGTVTADRAVKYGSGMGVLVRRHATVVLWVALLAYDLLRAAIVACRGRMHDASIVFAHARGLTRGYMKAALIGDFSAIEKRRLLVDADDV